MTALDVLSLYVKAVTLVCAHDAEMRAVHAEQNRAWHWKRRARGLCHLCGRPNPRGWEHPECSRVKYAIKKGRTA